VNLLQVAASLILTFAGDPVMNVPRNLAGKDFTQNKYAYFDWIRENEPVYKAKMFVMDIVCLSRYQDCADIALGYARPRQILPRYD